MVDVSKQLADWPAVTDTFLDVNGRRRGSCGAQPTGLGRHPQLLVHGLGGSSVTWVEVIEGLSEHGPVVAVDLPGFGRTPIRDDDPLTCRGTSPSCSTSLTLSGGSRSRCTATRWVA